MTIVHQAPNRAVDAAHLRSVDRYPVMGALFTLMVPIGAWIIFPDWRIGAIILVAALWLVCGFSSASDSTSSYSACRLYLPIFMGYNSIGLFVTPHLDNRPLLIILLFASILAFWVGWYLGYGRLQVSRVNVARPAISGPANLLRGRAVSAIFLATLLLYSVLWFRAGALPVFAADPNLARTEFYPSGYIAMFIVMGVHVSSFSGLVWLFMDRSKRLIGAALWLSSTLLGLGTANRGIVFIPIVCSIVFIGISKRLNFGRMVPWFVIGIVLFSVLGYSRSVRSHGQAAYTQHLASLGYVGESQYLAPIMKYLLATADTFDKTVDLVPHSVSYAYGAEFFSPLLLKQSVDLYLKSIMGETFKGYGLALGSMNAFYLDWGVVGVVLGPFALGLLASYIFRHVRYTGDLRWNAIYGYVLTLLLLSNYGHPFAYLYYMIEPVLLWLVFSKPQIMAVPYPASVGDKSFKEA